MEDKRRVSGASEENRTPTPVRIIDFESIASTSSATEAFFKEWVGREYNNCKGKSKTIMAMIWH
ncbi:MAG: hypothetical protein K0R98_682 [Rickettsiaceae bacterium]|nr:hypothetical protein [Rickettsiaceae bacterium]